MDKLPTPTTIRFGEADLTSCDREPIHVPGAIQPHGVLLVVDRETHSILQQAGDTQFLLGIEPGRLAQLTLADVFEDDTLSFLGEQLGLAANFVMPYLLLGVRTRNGAMPLDLTFYPDGDMAIVEAEPARRAQGERRGDPLAQVKAMLAAIQSTSGVEECCQATATEMRTAIGYDRVVIYKFLEDDSGVVVAEDKVEALVPFLGMHYPAGDIPQQARELYRRNWIRLIPQVQYEPASLTPALNPRTGRPLDMSHCSLRSVSPVHLEYLRNMGVAASMSMSIVVRNKLWGLIVCHNDSPRYVSSGLRVACELFAQIFSLHIEAKEESDNSALRISARTLLDKLIPRVAAVRRVGPELTRTSELLELVSAQGAAVFFDGELSTVGVVPPRAFIEQLVNWLNDMKVPLFECSHLADHFPGAGAYAAEASGLLAVAVSRSPQDFILWFRPELTQSITWAGNPHKAMTVGPLSDRLTPRQSFAAWQEEVRGHSTPWSAVNIEAANALRITLLEVFFFQVEQASQEREAANAQLTLLMGELDHRVKNMLATIQALIRLTKSGKGSVQEFATSLVNRIRSMAHTHNLLSASRWEGATVQSLLEEELAPFRGNRGHRLSLAGEALSLTPMAALPVSLMLHELTTNALKYGALSVPTGCLDISWQWDRERDLLTLDWIERNGPAVSAPTRTGFGTVVMERTLKHELNGSARQRFDPEGFSCTITLPAVHIVRIDEETKK